MYIPHLLYPFTCLWTLRLLSCLGSCNTATNNRVHVSFQISVAFLRYTPRSGIVEIVLFLVLRETSIWFSTMAAPRYIPTNNVQRFLFLNILSNIFFFLILNDRHSDMCKVISHCGSDSHLPDD